MDKFIELTTAFLSRHFIPLDEGNRKRIVEDTVGTVKKKKKKTHATTTTTTTTTTTATAAAPFPTTPPTTTAGRRQAVAAAAKVMSSGLGKNVVYNTTSGGGGGGGGGGSSGSTMKSSWVRSHYKRQGYTFLSSCLALYIDADVDLTKVREEGCKKVAGGGHLDNF